MEKNEKCSGQTLTASGAPSRPALAARSLAAVDRIADTDARREAFARHMSQFPPTIGRVRPV